MLPSVSDKREIVWVNNLRAICILFVYLAHTESYYGVTSGLSVLYSPFYVNAFFVASGYLFFRKFHDFESKTDVKLFCKKQLANLFFRIVIPSVLFSVILLIPKYIYNGKSLTPSLCAYNILGGMSFWFTSCLAVAQLCLLLMAVAFYKKKHPYIIGAAALCVAAVILRKIQPTPFPWFYKAGMCAVSFLVLGGVFLCWEQSAWMRSPLTFTVFVIGQIIYLFVCTLNIYEIKSAIMNVNFNFTGLVVACWSSILLIYICKMIKPMEILKYIGRNSLTFYFLCGLYPSLFSVLMKKYINISSKAQIGVVLFLALIAVCAAYFSTVILNRYFSWVLDCRILFSKDMKLSAAGSTTVPRKKP